MNASASLPRLASSSRCFHVAKLLLCEATSSKAKARTRFISTDPTTSTSQASVGTPKLQTLAQRLQEWNNKETLPSSSTHSPKPLEYKSSGIQLKTKKRKKAKRINDVAETAAVVGYSAEKPTIKKTSRELKREMKAKALARALGDASRVSSISFSTSKPSGPPSAIRRRRVKVTTLTPRRETADGMAPESRLVSEHWAPEPWSRQVKEGSVDPESAILENNAVRVPPPHINPSETLTEGVVEPEAGVLVDVAPRSEHLPVSTLAHGLDRVLFNPGVHWLQDPRSHVYNFTPWLEKIPKVNDFAFERLTGFVKSSRDEDLRALAKQEEKKFAGSTSSMSGMLSHIYFLISEYKDVELSTLSQHFSKEATGFTSGQRIPATVTLNYQDGIYAIDSRSDEYDDPDKNVLTWLGTLLENFLTKTPAQFNKFMRLESAPIEKDEKPMMREAFRFAKSDKFVMRSQLDCQDKRLPGTGVFDIKTRACISIRMDILNYEENAGYMIKSQHGLLESFEREYYDLIRSAFLKYSFQVRIGNMDGVMVAYHNTERIFGFQYISLDEMDERLYGPVPGIGDKVFNKCVGLLEAILEEATKCFPEQSVLCAFETRQPGKGMDVFVQPAEWNEQGEERPLKQLLVRVQNELDGESVRPAAALRSTTQKWTMKYSISEVVLPKDIIKNNLKSLEQRKSRTLVLPTSVALDDAKEYWEKLNYSNQLIAAEDLKEFRPEAFTIATAQVQRYRDLAREGRALYKELERRQAGKPKIVLGQGVYEEEESLFFKDPHSESEMDQEFEPSTQEQYAPSEPASAESNLHDKSDEE